MEAKLVVVGGDVKTSEVNLRLPCIVGRGRGSGLVLPHPLVSRQHCELFEKNGKLVVRDLGSLNGTYINNTRLTEPTHLPAGDLLTIGTVTFRAEYGPGVKKAAAAARKAPESETPEFLSDDDAEDLLSLDELNETSFEDMEEVADSPAGTAATAATKEDLDDDIMSYLEFGDEGPKTSKPAPSNKPGKPSSADRRKTTDASRNAAAGDENETLRAPGKARDDRR
jgi:predicted component of type VI protein secretion system